MNRLFIVFLLLIVSIVTLTLIYIFSETINGKDYLPFIKRQSNTTTTDGRKSISKTTSEESYETSVVKYIQKWSMIQAVEGNALKTYIQLLDDTHRLLVQEQEVRPLVVTRRPVSLSTSLDCANQAYNGFLEGTARIQNANIIDVMMFGYELMILEIRLHELYDVVDEFIIFESNLTFKLLPKPLFFYENRNRFQRFLDKITLVTPFNITKFNSDGTVKSNIDINKSDLHAEFRVFKYNSPSDEANYYKDDFRLETKYRMMPFKLYEEYVRKFDAVNDIFIHGDIDEIPSSNMLNHFKHCNVKQQLYPFSIWSTFYIYSFNLLFRNVYSGTTDLFSSKYPNILVLHNMVSRGAVKYSDATLLPHASGCHMNRHLNTLALRIYKSMSQSDSGGISEKNLRILSSSSNRDQTYDELKKRLEETKINERYKSFISSLSSFNGRQDVFVPWVVKENKQIYQDLFFEYKTK